MIFASRNDPVKGGDLFIQVLSNLGEKIKTKMQVSIYGFSPKTIPNNLPLIKFFNFVSQKDLAEVYRESDICVVPSIFDNSPNTVYEAMAYGKIIIASNVGGIPEIIKKEENGFLFKKNDPIDLADKIKSAVEMLLAGDGLNMRLNAKRRINKYASLSNNVNRRLKLL